MARAPKKDDAATSQVINIPAIRFKTMNVTIHGLTPLLTCRFGDEEREKIENKQQQKQGDTPGETPRDPQAEFESHLHTIADGVYGFPAGGIKKSLVAAGGRFAGKVQTHLRGMFEVMGGLLRIDGSPPVLDAQAGKIGGRTIFMIYRPRFDQWSIDVPVKYNADLISPEQLLNLFNLAGFAVGIGSFRPEKSGPYGQFSPAQK